MKERPNANIEIDLRRLEHVVGLTPIGIGNLYLIEMNARGHAPVD